ncbi:D-inositol 3-phosphate glycosyltransferase [mine drainage metagenome]|uniref:D-inositol 3-phosphate glycosyltransferase n=1 Tax=mine drainage metagenome TaxID=410659 RepID=A0A1J5STJ0_9ZZZZ
MRITIVMGHADLMPPDSGDSTARSWNLLATEFAKQGHEVTILSRRWRGTPAHELREGVRHIRVPGFDRTWRMGKSMWRDFRWSGRTMRAIPDSDVTVTVGGLFVPLRLGYRHGRYGRIVVAPAGLSRKRFRLLKRVDSVLAISSPVKAAIASVMPKLTPKIHVVGFPIDWQLLSKAKPSVEAEDPVTIGYLGRLHPEKGTDVLVQALEQLQSMCLSQPWRVVFSKARESSTGSTTNETYATAVERRLIALLGPDRFVLRQAPRTTERLVATYYEIDVFCYPSLQRTREIYSLAVVEAMASGAVPVVSDLPFVPDLIENGVNGEIFDPRAPEAADRLARTLARLVTDRAYRATMSEAARQSVYRFDVPLLASRLLADFATLALATK